MNCQSTSICPCLRCEYRRVLVENTRLKLQAKLKAEAEARRAEESKRVNDRLALVSQVVQARSENTLAMVKQIDKLRGASTAYRLMFPFGRGFVMAGMNPKPFEVEAAEPEIGAVEWVSRRRSFQGINADSLSFEHGGK